MPCYMFTYHAYRSWMPDRPKGFVRRRRGILPPDEELAEQYRANAKEKPITFDARIQQLLIDEAQTACNLQRCRGHFVATEPSHLHVLVSWADERSWQRMRNGMKSSLTRRLNRELGRRRWFVDSASRKRLKDRAHFDYLVTEYLPAHSGWKWREGSGCFV